MNIKNRGRPSTKAEPDEPLNSRIPRSLFARMELKRMSMGVGRREYLIRLIEADLERPEKRSSSQ